MVEGAGGVEGEVGTAFAFVVVHNVETDGAVGGGVHRLRLICKSLTDSLLHCGSEAVVGELGVHGDGVARTDFATAKGRAVHLMCSATGSTDVPIQ